MPAELTLNTSVQHHKTDRNILDYRADIKPFGGNEVLGMTGLLIPPANLSFLAPILKAAVLPSSPPVFFFLRLFSPTPVKCRHFLPGFRTLKPLRGVDSRS
ncbi:hypothetical protein E2C01_090125 [Portunus trituberculatus]|uniref:Uncharacterized protein n=1 Tax=Portunus trituberculatus TaxID=210409 RepID=A0A5B7JKJ6_PORTR|nr:hypothetical protein [Portunus trituberculatus]